MKKDATYVALDDRENSIAAGILRPKATEPELRQLPNEPRHLGGSSSASSAKGRWGSAAKRGLRATTATGS